MRLPSVTRTALRPWPLLPAIASTTQQPVRYGTLPNSARILREWFPYSSRGRAQGIVTTAMLLGGAASYTTSQWLIDWVGWRWSFGVFALIGVAWAFAFYLWFRDDQSEHLARPAAERLAKRIGITLQPLLERRLNRPDHFR